MASSSAPAPTEAPSPPPSFPASQLPVSQFIDLDSLGTATAAKASAVLAAPSHLAAEIKTLSPADQHTSQPAHNDPYSDRKPWLSPLADLDNTETPPFSDGDLPSSNEQPVPPAQSQDSVPAASSYLPPPPTSLDSNQTVEVAISQPDEWPLTPTALPHISVSEDEPEDRLENQPEDQPENQPEDQPEHQPENQPESGIRSMFFFTSSLLPKVSKINTGTSPATLKKTRGRSQQPESVHVKQNVVSMPQHLKNLSSHSLSPSGHELPRGRSVSAQLPVSTASASHHDVQVCPPVPVVPSIPEIHQQQRSHHQQDSSLGSEAAVAAGLGPRSFSPNSSEEGASLSPTAAVPHHSRRKSWLPGLGGSRLRSKSHEPAAGSRTSAWVLSPDSHADYNTDFLMNCEKVPELWDDNGGLYVYLSSPHSGHGPSFKVHMSVIEQSRVLSSLAQNQTSSPVAARSRARSFSGRDSLATDDAHRINSPPMSPTLSSGNESRLHLPVGVGPDGKPELERLIALRNLFALLTGQPLVATHSFPTVYAVLIQVSELLHEFEFGFATGSNNSFGEAVDISIDFYADQSGLFDVRSNREKTLEALVLGEKLRFWPLYNEAFCHAVGKYPALRDLKASPFWAKISPNTLQRLERAHLDLVNRQHSVNTRLEQFDFPSLFAGIANSTSHIEYRNIRFKNWRTSFSEMRAFVLKYYKTKFGSWPPKASSRRNPFSESGLNRLVLKTMYADLCSVYDLLVNRNSITTRAGEDGSAQPMAGSSSDGSAPLPLHEASILALRQVLAEFDQSSPPVLPPIPFDAPKLPTMASFNENFPKMSARDQARLQRSVQSPDLQAIIKASHNPDAERPYESPFLAAFETFEFHEAKSHKSEHELSEMRIGHWLFLYVVLQSMPMLVIDAPGLRFTEGVEYFLCEPPQGRPPWVEDAGEVRKAWFQTAGGAGPLVELSADVLLYSVEATYHRSHCWLAAKKWESEKAGAPEAAAADGDMRYAMQSVTSVASVPSVTSASVDGGTAVTQPDLPMGSMGSGVPSGSGGSAGSAYALGLVSPVSTSSNPSLSTLATMVSATDSGAAATGSNSSSPRILPALRTEAKYNNADYETSTPVTSSPALGPRRESQTQYSPKTITDKLTGQHVPPTLSLPQPSPQRRDNYRELQERANLRHASIGWALEPVSLDKGQYPDELQKPIPSPFAGARRIASAGNLRIMTDPTSNANATRAHSGQRQGSGSAASPVSLTVPGVTFNSDSTFDSILSSIDADASKKPKKRSSFLPFM